MTKQDLKKVTGISTVSIVKLGKQENITTSVLIKICEGFKCDLVDIMELVDADTSEGKESSAEP